MKKVTLICVLAALACLVEHTSAYVIKVPLAPTNPRIVPVGWVHIQKLMLPLFENVCEESTEVMVERLSQEFTFDSSNGGYTKDGVLENLESIKTGQGFLMKGEIFSEYETSHITELKALYEVLYYAKDFDTFYKAACWARQNINCGLFIDALYLAVLTRSDTMKLSVPPPYEVIPNYFIRKDVIIKASTILASNDMSNLDDVRVENNAYVLDANYSTVDIDSFDEDSKLSYFREDVGLNTYYFLKKLRYITSDLESDCGEHMFMMMKQFAARYDLERYANGLQELEGINWNAENKLYDPMLIYSNGNDFKQRITSTAPVESAEAMFIKNIENNLGSIVTHLLQAGYKKPQILNHLMAILTSETKNYENMSRNLLDVNKGDTKGQYSTLEHYLTTMRDPMYWKINKKIVELLDDALKMLPSYTRAELYFPGVEILNLDIKKIMTSFDIFEMDVTDALKSTENTSFQVKIAQPRLSHKPFTMKLNISSLVPQKGLVKIFIGPKTMPGQLARNKNLFVLLDQFDLELKRGINVVSRSSDEIKYYSSDLISLQTLRKKVEDAEFGLDSLPLKDIELQSGYPSRLILPKGTSTGLPVQFFVIIAPFYKNSINTLLPTSNIDFNAAILSPGFPFDLKMEEQQLFNLPNALIKEVAITHKAGTSSPLNGNRPEPKRWDTTQFVNGNPAGMFETDQSFQNQDYIDYNEKIHTLLGDRPTFTYNSDSSNYSSKRNQLYKKDDYSLRKKDNQSDLVIPESSLNNEKELVDKRFDSLDLDNTNSELSTEKLLVNNKSYTDVANNQNVISTESIDRYVENKTRGLLGVKSPKIKNKDKTLITTDKNYLHETTEENVMKQEDGNTEDYGYKKTVKEVNVINERGDDDVTVFKNKSKTILIEDKNNTIQKNIVDSKTNKLFDLDIINEENMDSIIKEIRKINEIPVSIIDSTRDTNMADSKITELPLEPTDVEKEPKRRVTVYDYLYNSNYDEDKVYE